MRLAWWDTVSRKIIYREMTWWRQTPRQEQGKNWDQRQKDSHIGQIIDPYTPNTATKYKEDKMSLSKTRISGESYTTARVQYGNHAKACKKVAQAHRHSQTLTGAHSAPHRTWTHHQAESTDSTAALTLTVRESAGLPRPYLVRKVVGEECSASCQTAFGNITTHGWMDGQTD